MESDVKEIDVIPQTPVRQRLPNSSPTEPPVPMPPSPEPNPPDPAPDPDPKPEPV